MLFALAFMLVLYQPHRPSQTTSMRFVGPPILAFIHAVNATTGTVASPLFCPGYPGGSSATIAQRPSDGLLFYAINAANGQVYRYNYGDCRRDAGRADTPLLGGSRSRLVAHGFPLRRNSTATAPDTGCAHAIQSGLTGVATAGPTITGFPGQRRRHGFLVRGTLYVINSARQLFTPPAAGGAATLLRHGHFPGRDYASHALVYCAFRRGRRSCAVQPESEQHGRSVSLATLVA